MRARRCSTAHQSSQLHCSARAIARPAIWCRHTFCAQTCVQWRQCRQAPTARSVATASTGQALVAHATSSCHRVRPSCTKPCWPANTRAQHHSRSQTWSQAVWCVSARTATLPWCLQTCGRHWCPKPVAVQGTRTSGQTRHCHWSTGRQLVACVWPVLTTQQRPSRRAPVACVISESDWCLSHCRRVNSCVLPVRRPANVHCAQTVAPAMARRRAQARAQ